jgi:hypothetical protein
MQPIFAIRQNIHIQIRPFMKQRILFALLAILLQGNLIAQPSPVSLPTSPPYTQNFNTTPGTSGSTYPSGWGAYNFGTSYVSSMSVGTSSSTTGAAYNYGSNIGLLGSSSNFEPGALILVVANTTGKTGLTISWDVVKVREQTRDSPFGLQISTTSATSGFTTISGGAYQSGTIAQGTTTSFSNINISAYDNYSGPLYIRWYYGISSGSGSRDGLAIDNVSISWSPAGCTTVTPGTLSSTSGLSFCGSGSTTINGSAMSSGTGIAYSWKSSTDSVNWNNVSGNTTTTLNTGTITDTTYYRLITTCTTSGAKDSASIGIRVRPIPTATLSGATTICSGNNANITFSGTPNAVVTYNVNGGSNQTVTLNSSGSATVSSGTLTSNATYSLVSASANGCSSALSGSVIINVNPLPTALLTGADTICDGQSATLSVDLTGSAPWNVTYTDGTLTYVVTTSSDPYSIVVSPTSTTTYSITSLTDANCTAGVGGITGTPVITVNPVVTPGISISSSADTVCAGIAVTYTATAVNEGTTPAYQWYLNGTPVGANTNTYTTTPADGDQVYAILTGSEMCALYLYDTSNTDTVVVLPVVVPAVSITAAPGDTICDGTTVTFSAAPVNGGLTPSYQWYKNGNPVGIDADTHSETTLANSDVINVVLTSSEACPIPASINSNDITMTVNPVLAPSVSISASPSDTICSGATVTFSATPVNGGTAPVYQWYINNNPVGTNSDTFSSSSLASSDVITVSMLTSYSCPAFLMDTGNAITMTVFPNVTPSISVTVTPDDTVCQSMPITFTATAINGGNTPTYQWYLNGAPAGSNSPAYAITPSNGDAVYVILTSNDMCAINLYDTSDVDTIVVIPTVMPAVSITAVPGDTICDGTPVTFSAVPVNGGLAPSYQWYRNGNPVGVNSDTHLETTLVNTDVINVVLTSSEACPITASVNSNDITMTVNPILPPTVTITASPSSSVCSGTNVTFSATPVNGGTTPVYQWYVNNNPVGTNSDTYSSSSLVTSDVITVSMLTSYSCPAFLMDTSNAITMTVTTNITPSVSITVSPNDTICQGTLLTFTATPVNEGNAPSYQWYRNGLPVGTNATSYILAAPADADVITVTLNSSITCLTANDVPSNAITLSVIPTAVPSVTITPTPGTTICETTNVTFTSAVVNAGNNPAYQWTINGNNAGTGTSIASGTLADNDIVALTVTSNAVCANPLTASDNISMNVNPLQQATVFAVADQNNICEGIPVNFTATSNAPGGSYQWRVNGSNAGIGAFYTYQPQHNDEVTVIFTPPAFNGTDCYFQQDETSNQVTMDITANLVTQVTLSSLPFQNAGSMVTVYANLFNFSTGFSIDWYNNGVYFSTTSFPWVNYMKGPGQDSITAVATDLGPIPACYINPPSGFVLINEPWATAVNSIGTQGEIRVYPQPAYEELIVEGLNTADQLALFDMVGKIIKNWAAENTNPQHLNLAGLASGNYILTIRDKIGQPIRNIKLTKQ